MSSLVKKFVSLSLPLKILISTLFSVIAGPGLLAFVSEYATYTYALNENIRPPLEGIPYLFATVAIASLFLSFIAISIFILTRWFAEWMTKSALSKIKFLAQDKYSDIKIVDKSLHSLKGLESKKALPLIFFISLAYSVVAYLISSFSSLIGSYISSMPSLGLQWLPFLILFFYFFIALLSLWKPIINWFIAISFAVMFYFISFTYIFDTENYSKFLYFIKYGGGINIEVEYKDTAKKEKVSLILRTSKFIFIKLNQKDSPKEIPLELIRSIKYEKQSNKPIKDDPPK